MKQRNKKAKIRKNGKKFKTRTKTKKIIHEDVSAPYATAWNNVLSELYIKQVVEWIKNSKFEYDSKTLTLVMLKQDNLQDSFRL